ncbi:hypothetical protein [Kribbella flavida]|uniref:hypothetical protein n=1 Tax=Kribbella flavida TaxID=182640 RepID=UPI0011D214A9|nr:hypothetical protein [Kribbella flavida]
MSSFPAAATRVRDGGTDPVARFWALRECVVRFPFYGFRATWHHVTVRAGVPRELGRDPESLARAVAELEEARQHWLLLRIAFAERRRREKALGQRQPAAGDHWLLSQTLAYCPNPARHPGERMVTVLHRLVDAQLSGPQPQPTCAVCGTERPVDTFCISCGVDPRGPTAAVSAELRHEAERAWRQIWRRTAQRPQLRQRTTGSVD